MKGWKALSYTPQCGNCWEMGVFISKDSWPLGTFSTVETQLSLVHTENISELIEFACKQTSLILLLTKAGIFKCLLHIIRNL